MKYKGQGDCDSNCVFPIKMKAREKTRNEKDMGKTENWNSKVKTRAEILIARVRAIERYIERKMEKKTKKAEKSIVLSN